MRFQGEKLNRKSTHLSKRAIYVSFIKLCIYNIAMQILRGYINNSFNNFYGVFIFFSTKSSARWLFYTWFHGLNYSPS